MDDGERPTLLTPLTPMSPAKTAESIVNRFGMWTRQGRPQDFGSGVNAPMPLEAKKILKI